MFEKEFFLHQKNITERIVEILVFQTNSQHTVTLINNAYNRKNLINYAH